MKKLTENKCFCVHIGYIIAILIAIIIGLFAILAVGAPKLYENISFASTMSSLILSIIAIMYALTTSGALANTLEKIYKTSSDLKNTSETLEQSNIELGEKVDGIPIAIASVKETVDQSKSLLEEHTSKISTSKAERKHSHVELPSEMIEEYINASYTSDSVSWRTIYTLYRNKTQVDVELFNKYDKKLYMQGAFFSTLFSADDLNLLKINLKDHNEREVFMVENLNKKVLKAIEDCNEKSKRINEKEFFNESSIIKEFIDDISKIYIS